MSSQSEPSTTIELLLFGTMLSPMGFLLHFTKYLFICNPGCNGCVGVFLLFFDLTALDMLFHSSSLRHIVLTKLVTKGHVLPFSSVLLQIESNVAPLSKTVTPCRVIVILFLLTNPVFLSYSL